MLGRGRVVGEIWWRWDMEFIDNFSGPERWAMRSKPGRDKSIESTKRS
jgi:hypothetical protein